LDLRDESLQRTVDVGFDGYAIGGLSVGEEKDVMYGVLEHIAPKMPNETPRYLMGVGTPEDVLEAISHGIDMFDCVLPTRNGRTGGAFTSRGKINIRNAKFTKTLGRSIQNVRVPSAGDIRELICVIFIRPARCRRQL
jgi:queuine tRNA-ribosyltransferase